MNYENGKQFYKEYLRLKKDNPDAIVMLRVGDFYETYDEDAALIAGVADLTLTSRKFPDGRVPMAGFPIWSAEGHFRELVDAGHKIVLAEEVQRETQ